jgi:hypothetical protein
MSNISALLKVLPGEKPPTAESAPESPDHS